MTSILTALMLYFGGAGYVLPPTAQPPREPAVNIRPQERVWPPQCFPWTQPTNDPRCQ